MATTVDKPPEGSSLEEELRDLELEENLLDGRAGSLELKTTLIALLAGVALIFSIAALAVTLIRSGNNGGTTTVTMPAASGASNSGAAPATAGGGMGSGMMAGQAAPVVNGAHVVNVQLGEMYAKPSVTSVPAGKVTFKATNVGMLKHELMVERMPIKLASAGKPVESAAQGMIADMEHGQSGHMTMTLKPGKYMLFCNVPGHYAAGQHTVLTVTRS